MKTRKNIQRLAFCALATLASMQLSFAGDDYNSREERRKQWLSDWWGGKGKWPKTLRVYASTYDGIPVGTVFHQFKPQKCCGERGAVGTYVNHQITNVIDSIQLSCKVYEDGTWGDWWCIGVYFPDVIHGDKMISTSPFYEDLLAFSNGDLDRCSVRPYSKCYFRDEHFSMVIERWMLQTIENRYGISECIGSLILVDGASTKSIEYGIGTTAVYDVFYSPDISILMEAGAIMDSRERRK